MKILMMTNTYAPHVGGVARSVESFTASYRSLGHRVMVVAPEFEGQPASETDVVRVRALQNFNGSDFSVVLSTPRVLSDAVESFQPDIVHAHHPFLIGSTALRFSQRYQLPLVFTHHTFFEEYTHYVPGDSDVLRRFVVELSTRYANLCDQVFAPSDSVAEAIRNRGVKTPVDIVPTGVEIEQFERGSGDGFRAAINLPADALVIGHLGRLAREKNLDFLTEAVLAFLSRTPEAHFLIAGKGPMEDSIRKRFADAGLADRLHMPGVLQHPLLASAYRAMDVFAFASQSETQGMVLTEAMAAGVPVVAVDAPGAREVVENRSNGRLLPHESVESFAEALAWFAAQTAAQREAMKQAARATAERFSMRNTATLALRLYERCVRNAQPGDGQEYDRWDRLLRSIEAEWNVFKGMAGATGAALSGGTTNSTPDP